MKNQRNKKIGKDNMDVLKNVENSVSLLQNKINQFGKQPRNTSKSIINIDKI